MSDPTLAIAEWQEDLLALLPREVRTRWGAHTTPVSLVRFLVRAVHELLQDPLGRSAGLADPSVWILDPAAGAGSFLVEAAQVAIEHQRSVLGDVAVPDLVTEHLEPHLVGFEILRGPFACGRIALQTFYEHRVGRRLRPGRRGRLLVDALGDLDEPTLAAAGVSAFSLREARAARRIRETAPITVVLGNPPFAGRSGSGGRWMQALLHGYQVGGRIDEGYCRVDGEDLAERNRKWLQDDAVRFLRLAQWTIERNREGIVAFLLPHTLVDALTYRGLRRSLLQTFEQILIVDLHGNLRKREETPDGGVDENVFPGIRQGIAMLFLIKRPGLPPRIASADLFGARREKLEALAAGTLGSLSWQPLEPTAPSYLFVRTPVQDDREYHRAPDLRDIFSVSGIGLVTGRDDVLLDADRSTLVARLRQLRRTLRLGEPLSEAWQPEQLAAFLADRCWAAHVRRVLVRPCEVRWAFVAPYLCARPRRALMAHLEEEDNLALLAMRQTRQLPGALVTPHLAGHKVLSRYDSNAVFPLYLRSAGAYTPNLNPAFLQRLGDRLGVSRSPAELLGYVYGMLYSPTYRGRFREALLHGFPRIPLPQSRASWSVLSRLGGELVSLHLTLSARVAAPPAQVAGDLDLNQADPDQLLREELAGAGVEPDVWRYRIGAYQVLADWLTRRRGRRLSYSEVLELCRVAEVLKKTLALERELATATEEILGCTPRKELR